MSTTRQDPRYFAYSPFPKRQCAVTGPTNSGVAQFLTSASNQATLNASTVNPFVVTFANGFDPFPVDYAYKWTDNVSPAAWDAFSNATHYLYIDYDPATDSVSYGSTTVMPNDDPVAPSHGSGVHWFDVSKYKMYESVASVWVERIRVFVGEADSNGTSITGVRSYAYNGKYTGPETSIPLAGVQTPWNHYIGSNKIYAEIVWINKTVEGNYSINDRSRSVFEQGIVSASNRSISSSNAEYTRLIIWHTRGADGTYGINKTTGAAFTLTPVSWRYIPIAERTY